MLRPGLDAGSREKIFSFGNPALMCLITGRDKIFCLQDRFFILHPSLFFSAPRQPKDGKEIR